MKIGFYVNTAKRNAKAALKPLTEKARSLGLVVTENLSEAEVLITLGGDGTILRAVHEFDSVSILGFNLGGLGYLSAVGEENFELALKMLATGTLCLLAFS